MTYDIGDNVIVARPIDTSARTGTRAEVVAVTPLTGPDDYLECEKDNGARFLVLAHEVDPANEQH